MNNINLNLYKIFYIVAKSKSLVDASQKLHISQPAISKDIKKLEDAMKIKLIYRRNNGISLTKDGEEFVKYLDEVFEILHAGEEMVKQKNDLEHATISIGCLSHISSLYLMEIIGKFKNRYSEIKIQITSASSAQLMELLQLHKLDFIIDTSMPNTIYNNIETTFLKAFDTIFISNKKIEINDFKELENEKWILPFDYTGTRKRLDETLEKYGIHINPSMELDVTDLIIDAVKRNLGIGYVIKDAAMIIGRINALNEEIASATIINEDLNDDIKSVVVGSFVCLKLDYGNNDVESFAGKLVALSGDITQNEITINSAIGRSILTKKIGDVVQAILPNGEKVNIEILNVF